MPILVNAAAVSVLPAGNRKKLHITNDGPDAVAYTQNSTESLATIQADRALIPAGAGLILDDVHGDSCMAIRMACPTGTASIRYTEFK